MSISKQMEEKMVEEYHEKFSPCKSPLETGREWWEDEREEYGDVSWKGSDCDWPLSDFSNIGLSRGPIKNG